MRTALLFALLAAPTAHAAEGCDSFPEQVRFCYVAAGVEPVGAPQETGPTRYFGEEFGVVLEVAPLSAVPYADPALMRPILNDYLARQRGFDDGLPVLKEDRIALPDRPAEQVVFEFDRDGVPTTVADTLALGDGFGLYVQTYAQDAEFTEAHRAFHDRVLAAISLPPVEANDLGLGPGGEGRPLKTEAGQ
ncbi:DUF1795 domain-containing protein [Pelagovum pacificum]|uniref:DUF1795 domain-containing protein n=1 Tax=Pelagovum pacificum TaxID=2588711 RepID=A0A5C5GBL8_9RHOB|nr:DUF1795 domain-containing protein [Pelagovum pacificum]QQA44749.1 hypothetical protein I8N54_09340 [Pelagovum pacificum]TNY32143.1 DUF1795 domain-containing protein [Pelagovum pacificum]